MDENINKHLHDILDAIKEIESFFGDKPKYFNEFCNDLCLRRAVERDIEIIGEAMNRILKEELPESVFQTDCDKLKQIAQNDYCRI